MRPSRLGSRVPMVVALLAGGTLIGWAIGTARGAMVAAAVVAATGFYGVSRRPIVGVVVALAVVASLPLFIGRIAFEIGPLSVHWTDLGLLTLAFAAAVTLARGVGQSASKAASVALWLVGPLLGVVALKVAIALLGGSGLGAVGVAVRTVAWYASLPMMALLLAERPDREQMMRVVVALAIVASVAVFVGNLSVTIGSTIAGLVGSRLVVVPGVAVVISRLVLPGMTLVPIALAMSVGHIALEERRSVDPSAYVITALLLAGLIVTFARGMWAWTIVALAIALPLRARARTAVAVIGLALGLSVLVLAADGLVTSVGGANAGSLTGLISQRIEDALDGDANVRIRRVEDDEVMRQTEGHELLGVPIAEPIGLASEYPEGIIFTIHNSYYATYGRLGVLGLVALGALVIGVGVVGVRAIRGAPPEDVVVAFAAFTGYVWALVASWTQQGLTNVTGVAAACLCAAVLTAICAATRAASFEDEA